MRPGEGVRPALHIRTASAGFGHQKNAGGHVPGIESEFPKRFKSSASYVSQIDRGRSTAAYAVRRHRHLVIEVDVHIQMTFAAGEAGRDQAVFQALGSRDADAPV